MDYLKYTNLELVEMDNLFSAEVDNLEKKREDVRKEIASRVKRDSEIWGRFTITKAKRYKFDIELSKAREFGLTMTLEQLDREKAKNLYLSGGKLPGEVLVTDYVVIKKMKKEDAS